MKHIYGQKGMQLTKNRGTWQARDVIIIFISILLLKYKGTPQQNSQQKEMKTVITSIWLVKEMAFSIVISINMYISLNLIKTYKLCTNIWIRGHMFPKLNPYVLENIKWKEKGTEFCRTCVPMFYLEFLHLLNYDASVWLQIWSPYATSQIVCWRWAISEQSLHAG